MEKAKKLKTKLAVWSETRGARVILGLLAFVLAYVFGQWALDSGSLLDYTIALTLVIFGIHELVLAAIAHRKGKP